MGLRVEDSLAPTSKRVRIGGADQLAVAEVGADPAVDVAARRRLAIGPSGKSASDVRLACLGETNDRTT